jgi:hypothetical protein
MTPMFLPIALAGQMPGMSTYRMARAVAATLRREFPSIAFAQSAAGRSLASDRAGNFVPNGPQGAQHV